VSLSIHEPDPIEARLASARERAASLQPFSPAWDAAMACVEDFEHELRERRQVGSSQDSTPAWPTRAI
jgi:hypothetical protein